MPSEKDTPATRRGYDKLDMAMADLRLNLLFDVRL
jgi:hypothetical protein